jgi:ribosomal protein S18 acetylase RimI-like enzyme
VLDQFSIQANILIRHAQQNDLRKLEWFGLLTPFRDHIERAYTRAERGEMHFLVADLNNFPVGQVWVELQDGVGLMMALRVLEPLRHMGIGTRLIHAAEHALTEHGLHTAEIHVTLNNPNAKRLYERLGYNVLQTKVNSWEYTPPNGNPQKIEEHVWVLQKTLEAG